MASVKLTYCVLVLSLALCACQKAESLDQLSRGEFSIAPDTITVRVAVYCPTPGKSYKDLFVRNLSAQVIGGELKLDSDADGLVDQLDAKLSAQYNTSAQMTDTNQDYFSDFLVYLGGITTAQQAFLRCGTNSYTDDDKDGTFYRGNYVGLNNCEEGRLSLTDPKKFDTDDDSIPDYLELRCGMNPRNGNDALLDSDADNIPNIEECKLGTPIDETNLSRSVSKFAAHYDIQTDPINNPGCMTIEISNLPVLNGSGANLIGLYLIETDGNRQLTVHTDWIEVTDGANGRTYIKDLWPDTNNSLTWRYIQPE